jgi:hypothetical protein
MSQPIERIILINLKEGFDSATSTRSKSMRRIRTTPHMALRNGFRLLKMKFSAITQ